MSEVYIKALGKMVKELKYPAEAKKALDELEYSNMMYKQSIEQCAECTIQCKLGAELVNAVDVLCYAKSNEYEIAKAKTVLEDNAAEIAIAIGSLDKDEAERLKVRVNEIAADYHDMFITVVHNYTISRESFAEAMAAAKRLLNA